MNRKLLLPAVLLLVALLGTAALLHKRAAPPPAAAAKGPVIVQTEIATPAAADSSLSAVGSLAAGEAAEIHAEIAGQISRILFEEGKPVAKGELLIQMDTSLLETDLARAKAQLAAATANFARDEKLKNSGFVSTQQWESTRAALEAAQAEASSAQIRLEKAYVRAPFDGVAGLRDFSAGDYATAGQALTTVISIDPVKVEFSVPEREYAQISLKQKIGFSVDAFPGDSFAGEIYAIDPAADLVNRSFSVKAFAANADGRLRPGMFARIRIEGPRRPDVITVAEEAIVPRGDDAYVFVVDGGKARLRQVVLGNREAGRVEVREGLSPGDHVVTAGLLKLADGAAVAEQQAAEKPGAPADVSPSAGK